MIAVALERRARAVGDQRLVEALGRRSAAGERDRGHAVSVPGAIGRLAWEPAFAANQELLLPLSTGNRRCAAPGDQLLSTLGSERLRGLGSSRVGGLEHNPRSRKPNARINLCLDWAERGHCPRAHRPGNRVTLPDPDPRDPGGARRPGRARQGADGLGQDARLRDPDRRAHRRPATDGPPRSCSCRPASSRSR